MKLKQVQHEVDNLHKDMSSTRIRDGIKPNLYAAFTSRLKTIGDMLREVRAAETEPVEA